jgi:hypothetical protein
MDIQSQLDDLFYSLKELKSQQQEAELRLDKIERIISVLENRN